MRHWRLPLLIACVLIALPFMPAFADGNESAGSAKDWLLMFFGFDWMNLLLVSVAAYAFVLLIYWQLRKGDGFDMRAMLARQEDNGRWTVEPG